MKKVSQGGIKEIKTDFSETLAVMFQFILWSELHHLLRESVLVQSDSQDLNHKFSLKPRMTVSSFHFGDYV